MNSRELVYNACRGLINTRPPVWLMRQAGRYMQDYRKLREKHSFMELCHNSELACEITMQPINKFDMDAAILFSDILVTAEALGCNVDIVEKKGPVIETPLRSIEEVNKLLPKEEAVESLQYIGKTLDMIRAELGEQKALLGFCGAPLTVASYMIEGGSSKDILNTFQMIMKEPDLFHNIMRKLTDVTIQYIAMQREHDVDALQVFESWASLLPEDLYIEHVFPYVKEIAETCYDADKPLILFALAPMSLWKHYAKLPFHVFSLPPYVTLADMKKLAPEKTLQGNLDSRYLYCSKETIKTEINKVVDQINPKQGFIFNLGHGITPKTPEDHVGFLCDTIKSLA